MNPQAVLAALNALGPVLNKIAGALDAGIQAYEETQRATLSLGMSVERFTGEMAGLTAGLEGGFFNQFETSFAIVSEGLQGNRRSLADLVNTQKLTGQNFKATAVVFAKLNTLTTLSIQQQEDLADRVGNLSKTFGVSTEQIVEGLNSLSSDLRLQAALTGRSAALESVVAEGIAKIGPQIQGPLERTQSSLLNLTQMKDAQTLAILGTSMEEVKRVTQSGSIDELRDFSKKVVTAFNQSVAGQSPEFIDVLGTDVLNLVKTLQPIAQAQDRPEAEVESERRLGLIGPMFEEAIAPFKQLGVEFASASVPFFQLVATGIKNVGNGFRILLTPLQTAVRFFGLLLDPVVAVADVFGQVFQVFTDGLSILGESRFTDFESAMKSATQGVYGFAEGLMAGLRKMVGGIGTFAEKLYGFFSSDEALAGLKASFKQIDERLEGLEVSFRNAADDIVESNREDDRFAGAPDATETLRQALRDSIGSILNIRTDDESINYLREIAEATGATALAQDRQPRLQP